ncbi:SDR family NAD(P)-dependent oxidoreductase [Mycobacterium sp. pUA109]|uniref:SDR family NAD(P)-dependent oxidoreductase n=1 Tax=Mycobacterium sp. pUA109 TaxID=3238982 RepID=UPI00351BC10C
MNRLDGKVALVTGGAGGIGGATAVRMAAEGAWVVVTDIDDEGGHLVVEKAKAAGGHADYLHLDVRDEAEWAEVMRQVDSRIGGLDILANVAGVCALAGIGDMSYEQWRWQFQVDLDGKFFGCRNALPLLIRSGRGSIVNISSSSVIHGTAGATAYAASKAGVLAFSKALAVECSQARTGIRVNSVIPGPIETPIWVKMFHGGVLPPPDQVDYESIALELRDEVSAGNLVQRAGRPDDIAAAIVFLASDEAGYINGTELIVDGGTAIV